MKFLKSSIVVVAAVAMSTMSSPVFAQGGAATTAAKGAVREGGTFVNWLARLAEKEGTVIVEDAAKTAKNLGVSEAGASKLYSSGRNAVNTLFKDASKATPEEIKATLTATFESLAQDAGVSARFLEGTGNTMDATRLAELALKRVDELTPKEQGELTSALSVASERIKGANMYIACDACVDQELKKLGVYVLARPIPLAEAKAYEALPRDYAALFAKVQQNISKIRQKGFNVRVDAASFAKLTLTEQQGFVMALERGLTKGTPDQREFFNALVKFSKVSKDGSSDLLATRLWTLLTPLPDSDQFISVDALSQITQELNKASRAHPDAGDLGRRNSRLSQWFDDVAKKRGMVSERKDMKAKNCFGIEA